MANMWFSVLVLIFVQNVFATYDCPVSSRKILNCDQCMRCGANWCRQTKGTDDHCSERMSDDWCNKPEEPKEITPQQRAGKTIEPIYAERSLFINKIDKLPFNYFSPVEKNVSTYIYNSTQGFDNFDVSIEPVKCDGTKCEAKVVTKVSRGFCSRLSTDLEFVYVTLKVDSTNEEAVIKYHVACACGCSQVVEKQSQQCTKNGDLSCGVCTCYEGWSGDECQTSDCENKGRGDIAQCHNELKDMVCSGNGYCGHCETCVCFTNMTGSKYFDRDNYCSDICMDTSGCQHCLTSSDFGHCDPSTHDSECNQGMTMLKYDEVIAAQRDYLDRPDWIRCNNTFKEPDCYVEYLAKKSEAGISIMVVKPCPTSITAGLGGGGPAGTKVPIILGVLGILAVVAAVGGVLLWKHLHAVPPMPFSSPDYQNIDAEDCVGENPLYKSPTSTFTNPQFGKC